MLEAGYVQAVGRTNVEDEWLFTGHTLSRSLARWLGIQYLSSNGGRILSQVQIISSARFNIW